MNYLTINSIDEFHKVFRAFRSHKGFGNWFRGQASSEWDLLPKAGRTEYFLPDNRDLGRFNDWEKQAIAYEHLPDNRLESLAVAQHHGLATRLLDWSQNPLVAAYFAVIESPKTDGAIYVLEPLTDFANEGTTLQFISEFEGVICYIPRSISPRVLNQKGMFTIHCPANKEIDVERSNIVVELLNLRKIIIPFNLKSELEKMLDDYGVNSSTLFPDLDGLSSCKNLETRKMVDIEHSKSMKPTADASAD